MTSAVLIDSSSWIPALRRAGDDCIKQRVAKLLNEGAALLTEIVLVELWHGVRRETEARKLKELQNVVPVISSRGSSWNTAYTMARDAHKAGYVIPATDIIIASIAVDYGVTLEHNDEHFNHIQKVTGRKLQFNQ